MANELMKSQEPVHELILHAQNLTRHYQVGQGLFKKSATVKALNGVSFGLIRRRSLAVVGESGCGKSTLARALTMIEPPTSGSLVIDGVDVAGADAKQLKQMRSKVQMVFQNPYASLNPRKKIAATLDEPLLINTSLTRSEREEKIATIIDRVGLRPEYAQRYPHMFSGGQRQRVAIARAMILNPNVVVADEPVSALDVSIQAQILNLFMDLQEKFATSYVFISHNLSVVEHIADDVMVMYLGSAVEFGNKAKLFSQPFHPYTQALMSATPAVRKQDRCIKIDIKGELPSPLDPPSGCAFHKRCPHAVERCKLELPVLRTWEGTQVACHQLEKING